MDRALDTDDAAHRIDIVLPCLNEAEALPWVLSRIPPTARAIVVDNGSTDRSEDIALALGATVVPCLPRGYGAACHAGLSAATAEYVAFCDCDASIDPYEVVRFVGALTGGTRLTVGRRRATRADAFPLHARMANRELARRVRRRTRADIRDVGPLRVGLRADLIALGVRDRRSGYPVETIVRAADAGWRIEQLDVAYSPRLGRSKVTGTVRGTLQAIRDSSAALAA
jgi:glycosyltransferase involved in cell wall biosynthesis